LVTATCINVRRAYIKRGHKVSTRYGYDACLMFMAMRPLTFRSGFGDQYTD